MRFLSIYCLLSGCLLLSCGNADERKTKPAPAVVAADTVDTSSAPPSEIAKVVLSDTLLLPNGVVMRLEPISESEFDTAPSVLQLEGYAGLDQVPSDELENRRILPESATVNRQGRTLTLTALSSATKLVSDPAGSCGVDYYFMTSLPQIHQWLIERWEACEDRSYVLVDQQTGKQSILTGYPIVFPKNQYIACGTNDFSGNGNFACELWKSTAAKPPKLLWHRELNEGVASLRWENDSTLLLEQEWIDPSNSDGSMATRYVRLRLP